MHWKLGDTLKKSQPRNLKQSLRLESIRFADLLPTANAFSKAIAINVDARIIKIKKKKKEKTRRGAVSCCEQMARGESDASRFFQWYAILARWNGIHSRAILFSLSLSLRPSVINESISQCNTPLRGRRYESAAASLTERGRGSGNQRRFPFLIEPRDFRVNHHRGGKFKEGKKGDGKSTWSTRFYKRIPFIGESSRSNRMLAIASVKIGITGELKLTETRNFGFGFRIRSIRFLARNDEKKVIAWIIVEWSSSLARNCWRGLDFSKKTRVGWGGRCVVGNWAKPIPRRRKRNANNFVPMIVGEDRGFDRQ